MAQDITQKQTAYVQRVGQLVQQLVADMGDYQQLKAEWDANGYATGAAAVDGTAWSIPDAQVQAALPACTAAMLNSAIGALAAIAATYQSQLGYLIVLRP